MHKNISTIISCLISRGVGTMSTDAALVTFFKAIKENDIQRVDEMLGSKHVSVDTRNSEAQNGTGLHAAAYSGHAKLVKLLVEKYQADVNATNDCGKNPLETAKDNYHRKICKYLIEQKSDKAEYAKSILNSNDVDELFDAAEANDIEKVSEMLDSKALDVDSEDNGGYRATVLHVAARKGFEEMARILVDKYKADINHEDEIGDRTIHIAAQRGHASIVKFLAERGSKDSKDMLEFIEATNNEPPICDGPSELYKSEAVLLK